MQDAWSTFFDQLKEDLARELQILEGKRSGSWQLRSREPGGNWRDMTQAEIERSEHTIKMLEGVIQNRARTPDLMFQHGQREPDGPTADDNTRTADRGQD